MINFTQHTRIDSRSRMERLHLITVAGLKRSGKTTVVEAIVSELHRRGRRVGTIKTMRHHTHWLNAQDTDTLRHAEAGASIVAAVLKDGIAWFENRRSPDSVQELLDLFPADIAILASEGVINPSNPQLLVLCLRELSALEETLVTRRLSGRSVVAISGPAASSWDPALMPGTPAFDVADPAQKKALVDLLLEKASQI
jgi:molybdopterin-guanine dinucleotide biosynthesis protein MobB